MKKAIFIDRDGTLVIEPPADYQLDSFEKLKFFPGVIRNLYNLSQLTDYEFVMVTNQDGLGTDSFPEDTFWPVQNLIIETLKNEGVEFKDILIDRSFPEDNAETRKPGTGMFKEKYLNGEYDLSSSFVIGDRLTDVLLAKNLGAKAIFISSDNIELKDNGLKQFCSLVTESWDEIFSYIATGERTAFVKRETKETKIDISLNLDGNGNSEIYTGLGFFDHMLEQIAKHSGADIKIRVNGDLNVDEHHTIEDTGIALGECFKKALGDKRGIERYGFALPMDDCEAKVLIDFGGRSWLVWNADFKREKVGDMPTEMFMHFFKSFSDASLSNLNIEARGENEHHKVEGIFKAFARALKMAIKKDVFNDALPSTKGVL